MKKAAPIILSALAVLGLIAVDTLPAFGPVETDMARRMAAALSALLRGLNLDPALTCAVSPACAGIRTAAAAAVFGSVIARSRLLGALLGIACGLALNLLRILVCELCTRFDPSLGAVIHATALYLVILPAVLIARILWLRMGRLTRLTSAAVIIYGSAILLLCSGMPPQASTDPETLSLSRTLSLRSDAASRGIDLPAIPFDIIFGAPHAL